MRTIQISDEDYEFLAELQHELVTQDNDGNADPVYWGGDGNKGGWCA